MTPERWQQISDLLQEAMELDPTRRSDFLAKIRSADPGLCAELDTLLAAHDRADSSFLQAAELSGYRSERQAMCAAMVGRRLGDYRVVEQIGEGGMGEVYRAVRDDDQYHKAVAIKLVRAGQDSGFVFRRFRNERQILAGLDHANIARLLDGGTTEDGVPFFVMELIDGEAIDQYCKRRNLPLSERLGLFLQVCSAVQYAHQRLIIHRDIKPRNILVTLEGVPKLLDFGIAKMLDKETNGGPFDATVTAFRILTPAYASPEQLRGEAITTASDVYSMGVVLYELLTGRSPFCVTNLSSQQVAQAVCELEPEKPSAVVRRIRGKAAKTERQPVVPDTSQEKRAKQLRGDLDNIVLMALRKEPQRRYASVEQFAADISRHLKNLPVIARKDTARYRAGKFVARHKAGVAAAVAATVIMLAALALTVREARMARQQATLAREQRALAEGRFNDVRKLANSLIFEIHDSIMDLPGATKARELVVRRALEYLDSLSKESAEPALQRELAAAYERIGDVQGNNNVANLADLPGASASYAKALAIRESLAAANPNDVNSRVELLVNYLKVFSVLESTGDFDGLLRALQKAWPLVDAVHPGTKERPEFIMSGLRYNTGNALKKKGDFHGALENYQQAARLMQPIASAPEASVRSRWYLAGDYVLIGTMLAELGRTDEARVQMTKGLGTLRRLSDQNPTNATLREQLAAIYNFSSHALVEMGDLQDALALLRLQKKIFQELTSADPGNEMAKDDSAGIDLDTAEILLRQGKVMEAAPLVRTALSIYQKSNPANKYWYATTMGQTYLDLGRISAALARHADSPSLKCQLWHEARSWYEQALDARSTGPGQRDLNGHDQTGEIGSEISRTSAYAACITSSPKQFNLRH